MEFGTSLCLILLLSIAHTEGCHSSLHDRKRRQVSNIATEADISIELREFFTDCLLEQVGDIWSWGSVIDLSVLDTQWYENTFTSLCRAGSGRDTTECWKGRLSELLISDSILMEPTRQCIDDFLIFTEELIQADSRLPRTRVKRQSITLQQAETESEQCTTYFPNNPLVREFITCNSEVVINIPPIREEIDFSSVSQFVAEHITCSSELDDCNSGNVETLSGNDDSVPRWSYRLEAITRLDSPVRMSASLCNNRLFPLDTSPSGQNNAPLNRASSCTTWTEFGTCSPSCGIGSQVRRRTCPINSVEFQSRRCTLRNCAVRQQQIDPRRFYQFLLSLFNIGS